MRDEATNTSPIQTVGDVIDNLKRELAAMTIEKDLYAHEAQYRYDNEKVALSQLAAMTSERDALTKRVAILTTACLAILPFVEEDLDGMETYATGEYLAAIKLLQAALGREGGK